VRRGEPVSGRQLHGAALPSDALVISLETSRELPGVKMGNGVILRVGDRSSTFDSDAGVFLADVAGELAGTGGRFRFQRALMSGGTCEGTAYQACGFQTGAVCVALGNYHNCSARNVIKAEYVSVADACGMVDLLVAAARRMPEFAKRAGKLPKRLEQMRRESQDRLRRTAGDATEG
jgi:endoglucanase